MPLDSYANLQLAIAAELNRNDLTVQIPDFITRFEGKARRALKDWLRSTLTLTAVSGDYLLPATVAEVLGVSYGDGTSGAHNFPLSMISREEYQGWMELSSTPVAVPGQMVTVDVDVDAGTQRLRFYPPIGTTPIATLNVETINALPALSATQTTNALLRDAPDLYLSGSCAEAAKYLQHDERVPMWAAERDQGFKELRILTERRLYGGAPRDRPLARVFG